MSERRIGVFVCHCGGNISDYVDVDEVRDAVANEPGVVVAKTHMFTCSDAAQEEMIQDIKDMKLDGFVVASCSPKLHLLTFRAMAERAGVNPYRYVQVNLREQCSWAHTDDKEGATLKGISLVRGGIARAMHSETLSTMRIETTPQVLVVGAGVAGLRAALSLADMGMAVHVVEREPEVGGWTGRFGAMFPLGRKGSDLVHRLKEQVDQHEGISLFTDAELVKKEGSVGDFTCTIRVSGGDTLTVKAGAIVVATGFDSYVPAEGEYGYGQPGVVTLPEYRELLDRSEGELEVNGKPIRDVVYIYCVGSRQDPEGDLEQPNTYCSRYCCTAAVHSALLTKESQPAARQFHLYRDMRTYGKYELLYEQARHEGSIFVQFDESEPPVVEQGPNGPVVKVKDLLTGGEELEIEPDLVVLVTGMVPRDNAALVDVLKLPIGKDGFFNEIHPKLRPVETVIDGVFIAGTAQGPKTLAESVASSMAAVAKSAALLKKGYVDLEPVIACVDPSKCQWCGECEAVCPYNAVEKVMHQGKEVAHIIPALCKGGGACVPVCPEGAIDVAGYTNEQILATIDALAREVK